MESFSPGTEEYLAREAEIGERLVPGAHPGHLIEAEHLARYQLAASLVKGRRVLDAGCGFGYGSSMLAEAGAASVTGIDLDEQTIAWAAKRYDGQADFRVGDLLALPFEAGSFDVVVSFEVLEHLTDTDRGLDEMKRVLSDGGLLVISSPNRGSYPKGNPFHLNELTTEEFEMALKARFRNVQLLRQNAHLATVIGTAEQMESGEAKTPVDAEVHKHVVDQPGEEIYAIGIAGDGSLPEVPSQVMLSGAIAVRWWHESAAAWESRARHAEAELQASRLEFAHEVHTSALAREELEELKLRLGARQRRLFRR